MAALLGCDADGSALPPINQEIVEIYGGVCPRGSGAVAALIKPEVAGVYSVRSGVSADWSNLILQQAQVADDINRNMVALDELITSAAQDAKLDAAVTESLRGLAHELDEQVRQFKT